MGWEGWGGGMKGGEICELIFAIVYTNISILTATECTVHSIAILNTDRY